MGYSATLVSAYDCDDGYCVDGYFGHDCEDACGAQGLSYVRDGGCGEGPPGDDDTCGDDDDDSDPPEDADGDGWPASGGDCDYDNPAIHPGSAEACNAIDDDCDGEVDEGYDADGDGFSVCGTDGNGAWESTDCNDTDPDIHPGALETCDGWDNDCDPATDEGVDTDQDGWTDCMGDCEDDDPTVYPDAPEACNGIDDDCDGSIDEDCR